MIRAFLLLLICSTASAQECYYIPVQCGPGGCCPPQYYSPPQRIEYHQPFQPDRTPPIGSPGTPKFEPRPDPQQPATPPKPEEREPEKPPLPPQWSMSEQEWQEWIDQNKGDNKKLLAAIGELNASIQAIPHCDCEPCDFSGLEAKVDTLIQLATQPAPEPDPPQQPAVKQHVVVIVDRNASWWPRISSEIEQAKDTYHGIQVSGLPNFPIGEIPQAVVYENSVPVRVVRGMYDVSALLARLRRGESI